MAKFSKPKEQVKDSHYYHERTCVGIRKTLEKKNQFQMDRLYERLMVRKDNDDLNERLKKIKAEKGSHHGQRKESNQEA